MRARAMLKIIVPGALSTIGAITLAASLVSVPALAADLYVVPPSPPPAAMVAPSPYSWRGLYGGLQGLYGWGNSDATFTAAPGFFSLTDNPALDLGINGAMVGGTLGYNFELSNRLVLGIEGDIAAGKISGTGSYDPPPPSVIPSTSGEFDLDWMATLRGRLGLATDTFGGNTLWYVTGGAAWAHGNRMIKNSIITSSFASATHTGWTVGAGFEHAINDKWSVKGEYLYVDLGSAPYVDGSGSGITTTVDVNVHAVKFGINRKLF